MNNVKPTSNANSDSNFVGIFGSESEDEPNRRRVLNGDDTNYEDLLQSSEIERDLKRSSVGGEDFDDMPDVPEKIATPPRRFNATGGRVDMKFDDIRSSLRHRAVTVESELDQERIDREMEKIADGLLDDNRAVSYDDIGLDSDLNPDDIQIDFRAQSDSESDDLSFGRTDPVSETKGSQNPALEEIQGRWTAVDAETATQQDIEVSGHVVTVNGPENKFKLIENRDSTLSLVVDNVKWWFRRRNTMGTSGKNEITWVSADNVRIKWKRVPEKATKVRADDEELVQKISDRRKQFSSPVSKSLPTSGSAPASSISFPKRTQSSAELQIDKLRSIIDSQKMEIQELRDKLKESSYTEINRLNKEIDRLKEVAKQKEEDMFHYKSAYEDLKKSLESQTHFRRAPLRALSEDRRENFNQNDRKQTRSTYSSSIGGRSKSESKFSVRSEPDRLERRASKDIRLARDNVELRERLEEKNDFIHRLLSLQEEGLSKALQEEVAALAAQLRDPGGRGSSTPTSPINTPITHKRNLSLGSFFEDDNNINESARVNRMENEIMKLNQKINIIKHASEQSPITQRKQNPLQYDDPKRIPYRKRTRSSSSSHHKRYRSYGASSKSRKARSHTPQILHEKYSTTKGAPRHRSLTAERTTAGGPVKRFRIDVYEDSENGSIESPRKTPNLSNPPDMAQAMYMSMPSDQQARINRIRKRFRNKRHTGHSRRNSRSETRREKSWYVSNVA